jgi:4-amino-4-deoxy-L-arabinose transferase-like glycosyltransferase
MSSSTDGPLRRVLPLAVILALGLLVRLLYLGHATSEPGFRWDDPDSYGQHAERLAREGTWFDFEAVEHAVEGRRYALPPLYPVFLSLFARLPGYPVSAQVAQALLATFAIALVYLLGREIHSERSGLVAALAAALWLPNVIAVWSTMQEALYVPLLLLGFVLLLRASGREESGFLPFVLAGVVLGLAALTRSMPLYYVPVAGAMLFWQKGPRSGAAAALALVVGFGAPTVPYSTALSIHLGAPTFIENHGGIRVAAEHGIEGERPPGGVATGMTLLRAFVSDPGGTARGWRTTARTIFHVNGGRLLQIYLGAETKLGARLWKTAVHALADVPLVLFLLLAPFGAALCRRGDLGVFLLGWIILNLGLTILSGFGGPRLRTPFEPHLMALGAVVLSGGYRRVHVASLAGAVAAAVVLAAVVLPQLGRSLEAKGEYGVHWPLDPPPKRSGMSGEAGFNLLAANGVLEFSVRPRNERGNTVVDVSLEGEAVETVVIDSEHEFRHSWPALELVHVELRARDEASGEPVRMLVVVPASGGP